ncbi:hypothetical protein, partial [Fusobacterium vincentii]|uniref:hypothetical protein n=1 Tax=Fusobacterium vincentii TaxID=155615 RepID=UPI001C9CF387
LASPLSSFERMKDKPGSSIMVEEIDKVEKVNDYEVKLEPKGFEFKPFRFQLYYFYSFKFTKFS